MTCLDGDVKEHSLLFREMLGHTKLNPSKYTCYISMGKATKSKLRRLLETNPSWLQEILRMSRKLGTISTGKTEEWETKKR